MRKLLAVLAVALVAVGCSEDGGGGNPMNPSQVNIEFAFSDLVVGTGAEAVVGTQATFATWDLWLYDAAGPASKGVHQQGNSTVVQGQQLGPISYTVGSNQLIPGFDMGARGMKVGGKRRLYVPASLAYGSSGRGQIPPNAALVFEIELTNVQ